MASQAADFTGSIPEHYDRSLGPRIFADYAAELANRVATRQPGSVLELAAGTGIVTRELRKRLPATTTLVASDLNEPMLDVARNNLDPNDGAVRFEVVDATNLTFDSGSFDAITCQFGVMFFPDKTQSYREARRVLTAGGEYLFNVWGSWAANPFARIAHEAVAGFFPDNPPGFYRVPFGYHDPVEIEQALIDAGFADVTADTVPVTSAIPSAADFATGLVFGNPLSAEIAARGGNPDVIRAAVADAIDRELGSEMPLEALFVRATAP